MVLLACFAFEFVLPYFVVGNGPGAEDVLRDSLVLSANLPKVIVFCGHISRRKLLVNTCIKYISECANLGI